MKRIASHFAVTGLAIAVLFGSAYAQNPRESAAADTVDFEQDGFRLVAKKI